ncbi:PA2169 family four-helix-bundle protein [Bacillus timonensis]|nr:PA2169 family four-helix-bundle protein [Bacillus timonensis]
MNPSQDYDLSKDIQDYLQGITMLVNALDDPILKTSNHHLKEQLLNIQNTYKQHQIELQTRLMQMGERPSNKVGLVGAIVEGVDHVKNMALDSDYEVIEKVQETFDTAIKMTEKYFEKHKVEDPDVYHLMQSIMADNKRFMDEVERLI